ncbi:hypothetical protein CI109_105186 [Kwoniella shandongensis]|uniref:Uncharacterized protein n=1 Tax=Kwoniella shandongensis TaxID=1734106 RepID=A0A5M6C3R5_9TREE|nr:uncharacterized protein CI109_002028 [Kwoniella shandongensis]KAA5529603.1 hypothetical protein CI109_002028 [Kwoniella shandongensis]
MACLKFLNKAWQTTIAKGGHDGNVLSSLRLLEARPGYLKGSFKIGAKHLNNHNTIHGGVILSLTDTITSLSLSTHGIPAPTGVSVNISTEFVRPGGVDGSDLIVVGRVEQLGKTLAYTRCEFYTPPSSSSPTSGNGTSDIGKLVAYGSQTKFVGGAKPVTGFSKDGETEIPIEDKKV